MTRPKRVLSIATLYPNAHTPRFGTFVARQLEALAARGDWDITVLNPIGTPPLPFGRYRKLADAAVDNVEHGVQVYRPRFTLFPRLSAPFNPNFIAAAALPLARSLHEQENFDLVDAQFFYPDGPAAARIARELNLPLSIKARGADISFWGQTAFGKRQMLAAARQATGMLAVSEALATDMAAMGMDRDKISIHYTGLDRSRFTPAGRAGARAFLGQKYGLAGLDDGPLFATVGALIPRKGQEFVINALAALPGSRLLLAGTGPDLPKLQKLTAELGLTERVHFLGSLDHEALPRLLCAADAMVLPSQSEGLANAWVEALACGTPLVITDAGGARELLRSEIAGRIVTRNSDAIALALRDIQARPPSPEQVAQTVARFSWESNAAELAEYYSQISS